MKQNQNRKALYTNRKEETNTEYFVKPTRPKDIPKS